MEGFEPGPITARSYILSRFLHQNTDWQAPAQRQTSSDLGKRKLSQPVEDIALENKHIATTGLPLPVAHTLSPREAIAAARRSRNPTHKLSQSYDSALGSSVASSNGDACKIATKGPCHDQETSSNQQPQPNSGAGELASKAPDNQRPGPAKRSLRSNNGDEGGDPDERENKRRAPSTAFPTRGQPPPSTFACPFRKRSPTTFHVRDYVKCANQEFKDIASLKKHITSEHYSNRFPCPRCRGFFASSEAVIHHLQNPEPCSLRTSPAMTTRLELGISQDTRDILSSRKDDRKVTNWDRLWAVLFGEHVPIRDHTFSPVVELEEVLVEFNAEAPSFIAALDTHLKTLVGETAYEWYRDDVEAIKTFVEQWMRELLDNCRGIPLRPPNNGQDSVHAPHEAGTNRVNNASTGLNHSSGPAEYGTQDFENLEGDQDAFTVPECVFQALDWTSIDPSSLEPDGPAALTLHDNTFFDGDTPAHQAEVRHVEKHAPDSYFPSYLDLMSPPGSVNKTRSFTFCPTQSATFPLTPAPSQSSVPTPGPSTTAASTAARISNTKQPQYNISKSFAALNTLMSRQAFRMSVGPEMARDLHMGQLPFDVAFKQLQEQHSVPGSARLFPSPSSTSSMGVTRGLSAKKGAGQGNCGG
ncbi:hypothetical protein B0T14DRAFT_191335 [Immersiella caudata]|uniref:C2H2-type domain-containing protein n=1 Tax=Immersiella caudata TaxID=314043 RepID=A0AA40C3R1_9PEZI|nr:hypothetical protein B0T14DRAFT_191335 [Immersiella caudata]